VNRHPVVVAVHLCHGGFVQLLHLVRRGDPQHCDRLACQVDAVERMGHLRDVVELDGVHSVDEPVDLASSDGPDDLPAAGVDGQHLGDAVDVVGEDEEVVGVHLEVLLGFDGPEFCFGVVPVEGHGFDRFPEKSEI
jgi:hypothetical protein